MPDYRRKKVHTGKRPSAKPEKQKNEINIPVRRKKDKPEEQAEQTPIHIIRGKKGERRKKIYVLLGCVAVIAAVLITLSVILPVSLFESAQNFFLSFGTGSFPIDISGNAVVDCEPKDNYYYLVTDTSIMAFTNGGKRRFSYVHGFSSPIIASSETRAIIFDQGKNTATIYNLAGEVSTVQSDYPIIAADIAKNGEYALVTKQNSSAATVTVNNRNGKQLYNINFARDMVHNVDIASSGKKIAVSTLNAEAGKMVSSVRVYDFNSADPVYSLDLGQDPVYDIENTGSGFFVATHNKVRYIKWSDRSVTEYGFEGSISYLRYSSSGVLAVYNKTNDKSINNAVLISNSGKKISEFEIKGAISDIRFAKGRVYAMGDNKITIYDKNGGQLSSCNYGFGGVKIAVTGSNTVCVMTDSQIKKVVIDKG